jgi:hypothetical protein
VIVWFWPILVVESETCFGSRVRLAGVLISFKKNFYRLSFTLPSLIRLIGPSCSSYLKIWIHGTDIKFSNSDTSDSFGRMDSIRATFRPYIR